MADQDMNKALDRYLSPLDVWAMAFGCAVGWGVIVMPGTTFIPVAGPAGTIIAMLIGMAVMLVIGTCFVYLMNRSTRTGGVYTYTKEAFGRDHAFLCSWFLCLSYLTIVFLNGSALFVVIRTLLGNRIGFGTIYTIAGNQITMLEVALSVVALVAIGLMFVVAKPVLQRMQTIFAILLFCGIVIFTIASLPHISFSEAISTFGTMKINKYFGIASLVILAPWAFVGFEVISFDTAHYKFSPKMSQPLIVGSILCAGLAYIGMTLVSISVFPSEFTTWQDYINNLGSLSGIQSVAAFYASSMLLKKFGLIIIVITAFSAILTGIIGGYRAMLRLLSTMAEDRILSEKFNETTFSILFIMVLSIMISLLGRNTLIWFVDLTSFGAIVAYGYTSAATWKLARMENNNRVAGFGLVGAIISIIFAVVQLVPRLAALDAMGSEAFLLLSLWCLLGFIFYWRTVHRSSLTEHSRISISGIVLFALLVYSAILWLGKTIYEQTSLESVNKILFIGGAVMLIIIFIGLLIMLYIQDLVGKKHESIERDKIRAVESSLAKSQFLFNMSHDIRTPMNAIIGYTHLAQKEDNSPKVSDYLDKIEASSNHLLNLINDILEMSRIENGKIELEYLPADLYKIFEDIKHLFSEQMKQKRLDYSIHTSQVTHNYVWCDQKNLNRILLNIISNAYKFTPEGGKITVTLSEEGYSVKGYAIYDIRIQDNGIGMSKEFVEKMFNAFERERTSTVSGIEGTGLGLAITKSIVDLMGGTIEVSTSPGSGTEFIIKMKMRIADEKDIRSAQEKHVVSDEKEIDFTTKRLLIVEDNAINLEIAKMILSDQGFILETAENGQIALDMVSASEPGYYDAILMDIQMPVMDGYEATKAIRGLSNKELAAIPILAMTANAFKEDEEAAKEAGMNAHIAKPIDVNTLINELKKVL